MNENVASINEAKKRKAASGSTNGAADWTDRLLRNKNGKVQACTANVVLILSNDDRWSGVIARNEFSAADASFAKLPPWDSAYAPRRAPLVGEAWGDADDTRAATWLGSCDWRLKVGPSMVAEAVKVVAQRNAFHPVREYLDALQHDGKSRISSWLTGYLGAPATTYSAAVGAWWLISAVARIYRPGAKADHTPVLEGKQGIGKSTALKVLAGEDWFTDELGDLGNKDTAMQLHGRLIVELGELDALSKAEVSRVKAFLSRSSDKYRPPWGRRVIDVPRQNVFAGTTNQEAYLKDESGARRFWPVRCTKIDTAGLERDRHQLWAEAVAHYRDGKQWWPDSGETADFEEQQEERRQADPWEREIEVWLTAPHKDVTTSSILGSCLGKQKADWNRSDEMRVAACMKVLGWHQTKHWDAIEQKQIRIWKAGERP